LRSVEAFTPQLILMACLLAASGFFSGSETALFSLTFEERREFRRRPGRAPRAVAALLGDPSASLVTILLCNMLANMSYFSVSTVVAIDLRVERGSMTAAAFGLASLAGVIVCGEVIPKALAVNLNTTFAPICAIPLLILRWTLLPVHFVLEKLTNAFVRVMRLDRLRADRMTAEELKMLVELSGEKGVLSRSERKLIAEVVEFGEIRVGEVMTPRVDAPAFDANDSIEDLRKLLLDTRCRKVVVYEENIDNILGVCHAKEVLLSDARDVRGFIREVLYVPSLTPVEKVLRQFRRRKVHFAIAVDEYGGFDGVVNVDDILEEIVGEIETEFEHEGSPVEQIGPAEYRVAGDLSIRDWNELFRVEVDFPGFDTIGGLVLLLLGHIPREGESVEFGQLTLTVERMRKRKIETIVLKTRNRAQN